MTVAELASVIHTHAMIRIMYACEEYSYDRNMRADRELFGDYVVECVSVADDGSRNFDVYVAFKPIKKGEE